MSLLLERVENSLDSVRQVGSSSFFLILSDLGEILKPL
jgi:hypothetical protein